MDCAAEDGVGGYSTADYGAGEDEKWGVNDDLMCLFGEE